jgi:hypothetical protein
VGDDAPRVGDDAPRVGDDAPRVEDDAPRVEDDAPRVEDDAPRVGDDAPRVEDDAPRVGVRTRILIGATRMLKRRAPEDSALTVHVALATRTEPDAHFSPPVGGFYHSTQSDALTRPHSCLSTNVSQDAARLISTIKTLSLNKASVVYHEWEIVTVIS